MKKERGSTKSQILSKRNKNEESSQLNTSKLDILFILTICFVTTFLILIFAHPNSLTSSDECVYLHLGKCIVDGSDYYFGFPDGRPIIPSIIAFFLYLGFDIVAVRLLIPIIFMNLALISTYALGKTLFGRKEAVIATLVLFTFPFFWGLCTMHVDVPTTVFTTLFLLFFYLGIEEDAKFLPISAIFISIALLTKMTAVLILVAAIFYLILRRKWDICRKKEFFISAMIIPLLFFGVYAIFHVLLSANMDFVEIKANVGAIYRPFEVFKLGFAPILIFIIFSISKEKRAVYLWLAVLTSVLFWPLFTTKIFFIRHLTPLLPIVSLLIATGFLKLLDKSKSNKKFICTIFILLLAVSFVHAAYLRDYHKETAWGITTLSTSVNELGGNGKIAIDDYIIEGYLQASTDKDLRGAFELHGYPPTHTYNIITNEWICKNDIEYIILSVYGELQRTKSIEYFHPRFLMIEMPYIKMYDASRLPQSELQFQSDLYNMCEKNYERVDVIYKDEQKVFIIYEV